MKFSESELDYLSTPRALEYLLLQQNKLDYKKVVNRLKYEKELTKLQAQLILAQNDVVAENKRVLILVEGREFAGKGEAIRTFTEHLNPRSARQVALGAPSEVEQQQWYFKRYLERIPSPGEMVFFDRSWYNRAIVEPVNGFCTDKQYTQFMREVNQIEQILFEDGIIIIKIYFSISKDEQISRIERVQKNPLRKWELSDVDKKAVELWDKYSKYEAAMLKQTDTPLNPWYVFNNDDGNSAFLGASKQILKILNPHKS